MIQVDDKELQRIEIELLLDSIFQRYGYDFRHYAKASLKRRITQYMQRAGVSRITDLIAPILHDEAFFDGFLKIMSVTVTDMFRDPTFFQSLRKEIIPVLKTYPYIKIWHAGCATGEEVYSLAILLKEEGLYERTQIYATDYNSHSLAVAKEGIYPLQRIQQYSDNYISAGGKSLFTDYYHARYGGAKMLEMLKENVIFANHNLVSDGVFGEMQLVICRNVLIYFDQDLQNRVLTLLHNSLSPHGFLCLGSKESLKFSTVDKLFEAQVAEQKIYKHLHSESS
ncbi:CheR-type protein glutamate methyltransferase [Psychromonas ingrahamii 37]|uniref:CheR-type protein glutamate methyltransferase n=1 Tax=Psychromonas ingrahamii (strain DSM 17664 / CCUG 51855 / 37) TaxID=357804 RepID=A1T0X9_PSYIN|nr:protein-glutamate O-methyltransferase CheR [Psychromonas ingrahamii]ABM05394.1 CheR-type protein glutamate methyltransferase [Psychromonas ingrahamii 37]